MSDINEGVVTTIDKNDMLLACPWKICMCICNQVQLELHIQIIHIPAINDVLMTLTMKQFCSFVGHDFKSSQPFTVHSTVSLQI